MHIKKILTSFLFLSATLNLKSTEEDLEVSSHSSQQAGEINSLTTTNQGLFRRAYSRLTGASSSTMEAVKEVGSKTMAKVNTLSAATINYIKYKSPIEKIEENIKKLKIQIIEHLNNIKETQGLPGDAQAYDFDFILQDQIIILEGLLEKFNEFNFEEQKELKEENQKLQNKLISLKNENKALQTTVGELTEEKNDLIGKLQHIVEQLKLSKIQLYGEEQIRKDLQIDLESMKSSYEAQIQRLRRDSQTELDSVESRDKAQIQPLENQPKTQKSNKEKAHKDQLNDTASSHKKGLGDFTNASLEPKTYSKKDARADKKPLIATICGVAIVAGVLYCIYVYSKQEI
ncbi:hypothetical protein [Alphaproteobacteria bacterium endosymbiont of Tiliacea citrago]|uniref:hypothetical protein n=1 Tax=Alphaproteobacteria bacterium endosymbiont of Tiliacea citrago TaxID=3077944 RepID=UPI00313D49C1